eukprot:2836121-Alexandrium_andersonii.AAC.1
MDVDALGRTGAERNQVVEQDELVGTAPLAARVQHVPKEDAGNGLGAELRLLPHISERWHEAHPRPEWDHAMLPVRSEPTRPCAVALIHPRV